MKKQSWFGFVKKVINQWIEKNPFLLASSLSYYTMFSLAPLLIIVIGIAGVFFGSQSAQDQIVNTIQGLVGQQSAEATRFAFFCAM